MIQKKDRGKSLFFKKRFPPDRFIESDSALYYC